MIAAPRRVFPWAALVIATLAATAFGEVLEFRTAIGGSATTPGASSFSLTSAVDYAIGSSVNATVLVSAGNGPGLAEDYTPSDQGSKSGVICVGAIDIANDQLASTRGPDGVNLWAPGDTVDAADVDGFATTVSGTSPATALAVGAALIYLSANPVLIPEDLKTVMVTNSQTGNIVHVDTEAPGIMTFTDWTNWFLLDDTSTSGNDDGDNWTNEEEYIWGFNPQVRNFEGSVVTLSYDSSPRPRPSPSNFTCRVFSTSLPR
jgi:hypothetical protein